MSEYTPEQEYLEQQFEAHANAAVDELTAVFLGNEAGTLKDVLIINVNVLFPTGAALPTIAYDVSTGGFMLNIEPDSLIDYAARLIEGTGTTEVSVPDLAKVLVGAGVARAILADKTVALPDADLESRTQYRERMCKKTELWETVGQYDDEHGTALREVVDKFGDNVTPQINVVRFMLGASLNYFTDVHDLQVIIPELFRADLVEEEAVRTANLDYNMNVIEAESAYALYDSALPVMLWGLSFPMTPAEELSFFAGRIR